MNTNHNEETQPRATGTHAAMSLRHQTAVMGPASVALKDRSEVVSVEGWEGLLAEDVDLSAIIGQMPEDVGRGLARKVVAFTKRCVDQ